jgi:pyruvate/2-oxoglutarate dehydrogenase complex dihydrolipoamide acyltransferase (E2) component
VRTAALLVLVALVGCSGAEPESEPVAQPVAAEEPAPEPEPEPTEVEVPDLRGLTFAEARQIARDLGLEVHPYVGGESRLGYAQRDWIIQSQMPRPGLKLAPGAEIKLNIEHEPEPEPEPVEAAPKPEPEPKPRWSKNDVEYQLASIQAGGTPDEALIESFAESLDRAETKCSERRRMIGDMAVKAAQIAADNGAETSPLEMIDAIYTAVPAELAPMACSEVLAGILVLMQ